MRQMQKRGPELRGNAFACAAVLVAGLAGCVPAKGAVTVCESNWVPPRDPAREELPAQRNEADAPRPPHSGVRCVTR